MRDFQDNIRHFQVSHRDAFVFLSLPIARPRSFCTLELTPTILYKPCSSMPGRDERTGEVRIRHLFTPFSQNRSKRMKMFCTPLQCNIC